MRYKVYFIAISFFSLLNVVYADGIKEGLWELKRETYQGIPLKLVNSSTSQKCIKKDWIQKTSRLLLSSASITGDCKEKAKNINSNSFNIEFVCRAKNLEMTSVYEAKIQGGSLELIHVTDGIYRGKRGQETTKTIGNYIGPCRK